MSNKFYSDTYRAAMDSYNLSIQEEDLNFQRAQTYGDVDAAAQATVSRAALLLQKERYHADAVQHATALQQVQGNRFGLTQDELDIAKSCNLSDESYARNKNLLQYRRATGQYRDDQGSVKR
jgi:hypothetical protein